MLRVGLMPYLNSEAFYYASDPLLFQLVPLVPSAMAKAARDGELDAGPIPLVDCFRLENRFVPVNGFCIATVERARSILLFSNRPMEQLGGATIAVTDETSTSSQLLRVLLAHRLRVRPGGYLALATSSSLERLLRDGRPTLYDAYLLIGDTALRNRHVPPDFPYRYDLGAEWHRWTGLPFVFARWIVRADATAEERGRLEHQLAASVSAALANVDAIARKRHADLGLTVEEAAEYVRSFRYVLGPQEERAMVRFRELLAALPQERLPVRDATMPA